MFAGHILAAVAETRSAGRLDALASGLWQAWGLGAIGEGEAGTLAAAIEARRRELRPLDTVAIRAPSVPRLAASIFPPKRRCASPDRAASIERRRRLAASGPMPPALAARFTTGELAALRIVADECRAHGRCERTLGEIAARAGTGVTTARNAIRAAAAMGLVLIVERRRHRAPNLPNVARIVSPEWLAWIARAGRGEGGGSKKPRPTDRDFSFSDPKPRPAPKRSADQAEGDPPVRAGSSPTADKGRWR